LFVNNPSLGASAGGGGGGGGGAAKECRYLHFQVQPARQLHTVQPAGSPTVMPATVRQAILGEGASATDGARLLERGTGRQVQDVKQWINCDLRSFDYSVLGQYVRRA
jgi:mRNA (2'-O-methyladenosine-N6-)-methyltransferase